MATFVMNRIGASQNSIPGVGDAGSEKAAVASYDWTALLPAATVLQGPMIQAGAVITGVKVVSTGLGSATLSVGDITTPARYMTGVTASPAASTARPFTVGTNSTVNVTTAAANTGATGSVDIVVYFLPRNA